MKALQGISISSGYARGFALVYQPPSLHHAPEYPIEKTAVADEISRMNFALQRTADEVRTLRERIAKEIGEQEAAIFDAHLLFINDEEFHAKLLGRVSKNLINCEQAVKLEILGYIKQLSSLKNGYMRERIMDFEDVGTKLLRNLRYDMPDHPLGTLAEQTVIVAKELLPSESVNMDRKNIAGIVTEHGGSTSHTAILARAMGIPCVVGIPELTSLTRDGELLLINGSKGNVTINPSDWQQHEFRRTEKIYRDSMRYLTLKESQACQLKGGTPVTLTANINCLEDVPLVKQHNLEGTGLFRTEIVFLGNTKTPGLAKQHQVYVDAAKQVAPHPMIIRTFDFSADKHPEFLDKKFLANGRRGVDWALSEKRGLTSQLHAILRAYNESPNIRVLLPMVRNSEQVRQVKTILAEQAEKEQLKIPPIGAMIETPLAVFSLRDMLPEISFSSIGCNDLAQYMLGIERELNALNLHDWILEPALLRTFETIFNLAAEHKHPVSVCGLAASDPLLSAILVGLGARAFSVDPASSSQVRYTLRHLGIRDAKKLAGLALAGEPKQTIIDAFEKHFPEVPLALEY